MGAAHSTVLEEVEREFHRLARNKGYLVRSCRPAATPPTQVRSPPRLTLSTPHPPKTTDPPGARAHAQHVRRRTHAHRRPVPPGRVECGGWRKAEEGARHRRQRSPRSHHPTTTKTSTETPTAASRCRSCAPLPAPPTRPSRSALGEEQQVAAVAEAALLLLAADRRASQAVERAAPPPLCCCPRCPLSPPRRQAASAAPRAT
jgi:hypothetical protein